VSALSKSRFLSGLQCHKKLWWQVHEPDAPELRPDENTQVLFDTGAAVGAAAREHVPGGVFIIGMASEGSLKVERTQEALKRGAKVIYEATFEHASVYASIDILERLSTGFRITEVKSTVEAKDEHVPDVAIQHWVTQNSGLTVSESHLMHLNRECRAPDRSNLFARVDLSSAVTAQLPGIPDQVRTMLGVLEGPLPDVPIGDHCDEPQECPFKGRCWPAPIPHDIENLRGLSAKKRTLLQGIGAKTIYQIPAEFELTDFQTIQRRAVQANAPWVDPALGSALKVFEGERVAFLDFETVSPAIPIWNGTGPYAQVPAQVSVQMVEASKARERGEDYHPTHIAWIADGPEDPRPGIAQAVVDSCRGADVVVAFNATFEKKCLQGLAEAVPALATELLGIVGRMQDLAEPIRKGLYYHPDFNGRYSLKVVVPALLPRELGYDELPVADGITASNHLLAHMLGAGLQSPEERAKIRADLLKYCERDTKVMVELLKVLKGLA
jgi:hypothetical protein